MSTNEEEQAQPHEDDGAAVADNVLDDEGVSGDLVADPASDVPNLTGNVEAEQEEAGDENITVEEDNIKGDTSEYVKLVVDKSAEQENDNGELPTEVSEIGQYVEGVVSDAQEEEPVETNETDQYVEGIASDAQEIVTEPSETSQYVEVVTSDAHRDDEDAAEETEQHEVLEATEDGEQLARERSEVSEYIQDIVSETQNTEDGGPEKTSLTSEYVDTVMADAAENKLVSEDVETGAEIRGEGEMTEEQQEELRSVTSAYVEKIIADAEAEMQSEGLVPQPAVGSSQRPKSQSSLTSEYVKSLVAESISIKQPSPPQGSKRVGSGRHYGGRMQDVEMIPEPPPPPPMARAGQRSETTPKAMSLTWSFGFNNNLPVLNLSTETQSVIAYACGHTIVLYDYENNTQSLLQGLANSVTCLCVSEDTRWLAAADCGNNSLIIVWDTLSRIPIRTIFDAHEEGVFAMTMTNDAKYLATVSAGNPQIVAIWDWTVENDTPIATCTLQSSFGPQHYIYFNPEDSNQFISNSETQVIFYLWKPGHIEFYAPPLTDDDFNRPVGKFSQSIYQSQCTRALTATSMGNLVLWDMNQPLTQTNVKVSIANKKALKLMKLQEKPITVLTTTDKHIVCGDTLGHIKFFDQSLMLLNWHQDFQLGQISSVSFAYNPDFAPKGTDDELARDATVNGQQFSVRNFVVSTYTGVIGRVIAAERDVRVIHRDHSDKVQALAAHPERSLIAVGGYSGLIKLWNYGNKSVLASRWFDRGHMIQCCCFDPKGAFLAVGFTNGNVHILDSLSLNSMQTEPFRLSRSSITHVAFSYDSQYLATADADFTVSVFRRQLVNGAPYIHMGRYRPHFKRIVDLLFGIQLDSMKPRLLSLGEDRVLVEFDLEHSDTDNLSILGSDRIEQSAVPYCMAWYPGVTKESFVMTANDQYKYKLYNSTTKMCRKTVLGPTYGSPVEKVVVFPNADTEAERGHRYMAYATRDKVGLQILPLDGNPHNAVALIGHPDGVSGLACSYDGRYVFSAGALDGCVHMWDVNFSVLEVQASLGGPELVPFYGLLDGGHDGQLFHELEDYFYYSMLRTQGVSTMEVKKTSTTIAVSEIPFVMRALGHYPSEQEIDDMMNEVKYSRYADTGEYTTNINLADLIKLYINHRPVFGLEEQKLKWAFEVLGGADNEGGFSISREDLLDLLQNHGEHLTEYELAEYLTTLLGYTEEGGSSELNEFDPTTAGELLDKHLPVQFTAKNFAENMLGFQSYQRELSLQTVPNSTASKA